MIKLSTGLALSLLNSYGLRAMMNYGWIAVYDGEQPISPDMEPDATLLARITTGGDPFIVDSQAGGALEVAINQVGVLEKGGTWILKGEATGTAAWWRWYWNRADTRAFSNYYPRLDGLVGESLVLADTAITPSTLTEIESFNVQFRGS